MTVDWKRYPKDWKRISLDRIMAVGEVCEVCGVRRGELIARLKRDKFRFRYVGFAEAESVLVDGWHDPDYDKPILVRLSVHHRGVPYLDGSPGDPHDKMDNRDENLLVVCARCHFQEELKIMEQRRTGRKPKPVLHQLSYLVEE